MKKLMCQIFDIFKSKKDLESEIDENYTDWDYLQLCELYFKNSWLSKGANFEGFENLWNDYTSKEDKLILKSLINNFYYLTPEDAKINVETGIKKAIEEWGICPKDTIFVAIKKTKFADGSSMFLHFLKGILVEIDLDWEEHNLISEIYDGIRYAKKGKMNEQNQLIKKIVLIDDFIGTGETAKKQIEFFKKEINENSQTMGVYFIAFASMDFGLLKAQESGQQVISCLTLKRGVDISFSRFRRKKTRKKLVEMENILADYIKSYTLLDHSLGWGKSETLYSFNQFNLPNNVFPLFWWKKYKDNSIRKTLFNRMQ